MGSFCVKLAKLKIGQKGGEKVDKPLAGTEEMSPERRVVKD